MRRPVPELAGRPCRLGGGPFQMPRAWSVIGPAMPSATWPRERWNVPVRPFLDAFYRAQRGLLEQKMLFGQRRERKRG